MPTSPPSRCGDPECQELTTQGRCEEHQRKAWANRSKAWGSGSTRKWREHRARQLEREPQCRWCGGRERLEVDHVLQLAQGGSKWDTANLQTLCKACHEVKSDQDRRQRTRPDGPGLIF